MSARRLVVEADKPALCARIAGEFVDVLVGALAERELVHVSLTGGSMGAGVLALVPEQPRFGEVDWARVHFWWSDERFLSRDDAERNALQAREALLDQLDIDETNIHEPAASDDGVSLDEAASDYAAELSGFAGEGDVPAFEVCFLGVGPDGHVASLFPGREEIGVDEGTVLAVRDRVAPPTINLVEQDPEIPVNIYDLGLIYTIDISPENEVRIVMTLTAPGCPVAGEMPGWVADAVEPLPGIKQVDVEMTFQPQWGMDMMSDEARLELGFM